MRSLCSYGTATHACIIMILAHSNGRRYRDGMMTHSRLDVLHAIPPLNLFVGYVLQETYKSHFSTGKRNGASLQWHTHVNSFVSFTIQIRVRIVSVSACALRRLAQLKSSSFSVRDFSSAKMRAVIRHLFAVVLATALLQSVSS